MSSENRKNVFDKASTSNILTFIFFSIFMQTLKKWSPFHTAAVSPHTVTPKKNQCKSGRTRKTQPIDRLSFIHKHKYNPHSRECNLCTSFFFMWTGPENTLKSFWWLRDLVHTVLIPFTLLVKQQLLHVKLYTQNTVQNWKMIYIFFSHSCESDKNQLAVLKTCSKSTLQFHKSASNH